MYYQQQQQMAPHHYGAPAPHHYGQPPVTAPPAMVLLRFDGASTSTERTEVSNLCSQFGEVAYVDFRFGERVGFVRFRRPEAARAAIDALTMYPQQIGGVVPQWRLLGVDEIRAYWASAKGGRGGAAACGGVVPHQGPGAAGNGADANGANPNGAMPMPGAASNMGPRPERGAVPRAADAPTAHQRPQERGCVLTFDGAEPNTDRADLMAVCHHYGAVAYVDFRFGATAGYVRFRAAEGARAALTALSSGTIPIGGATPTWRLLTEEEEEAYRIAVQNKKRLRAEEASAAAANGGLAAGLAGMAPGVAPYGAPPPPGQPHVPPPQGYGGALGGSVLPYVAMGAASNGFATGQALEPSAVLRFEGAGEQSSRESVSESCAAHAEVAFVDFRPGATAGYVRFRSAEGARAALTALTAAADGVVIPATWRQLSVAEAHAYREEVQAAKRPWFAPGGKGFGGGKGGGWLAPGKGGGPWGPAGPAGMGRGQIGGWGGGRGRGGGRGLTW